MKTLTTVLTAILFAVPVLAQEPPRLRVQELLGGGGGGGGQPGVEQRRLPKDWAEGYCVGGGRRSRSEWSIERGVRPSWPSSTR